MWAYQNHPPNIIGLEEKKNLTSSHLRFTHRSLSQKRLTGQKQFINLYVPVIWENLNKSNSKCGLELHIMWYLQQRTNLLRNERIKKSSLELPRVANCGRKLME